MVDQRNNTSIGTYYIDSNYCVSLDVEPTLLDKLLKQLCNNINTPDDDDNSLDNVEVDDAIMVGKKFIICDPMSKTKLVTY